MTVKMGTIKSENWFVRNVLKPVPSVNFLVALNVLQEISWMSRFQPVVRLVQVDFMEKILSVSRVIQVV